ncbi:hypothetical protein JRQ81_015630 [Phrynocephalus forsythii]|uniref:Uncharacterized protein n=1 Tax=Phrynocephalus forsythii TaxID=171643 RepID=A0A9Q0XUY0_9SAUR|nr:hypothetical protein JRQ81_015630 [Phrynocephalus forsythii]
MVLDKIKDKSVYKKEDWRVRPTTLTKFINNAGLKDVWRELKGDERKYTFYSPVHKSYSRIDFVFASQSLIPKVNNTDTEIIKTTDHAIMSIDIAINKNYREARGWRMNAKMFHYREVVERVKKDWSESWDINEKAGGRMGIIRGTLKAVARGFIIRENYNKKWKSLTKEI